MPRNTFAPTIHAHDGPYRQHERHWEADDPTCHQHRLARVPISEQAGHEIHAGLDQTEGDDEREDHHLRADAEFLGADERDDRALESHHAADEGVDQDEERELREVLPEPKAHCANRGGHRRHDFSSATLVRFPWDTGNPAERHSGNPSTSRRARRPLCPENLDRPIGVDAIGATAIRHIFLALGELLQTPLKIIDGNRQRARDVPSDVLACRSCVENDDLL